MLRSRFDRALAFARQHKIIAYRSPEKLLPYTDALLVTSTRPEAVSWVKWPSGTAIMCFCTRTIPYRTTPYFVSAAWPGRPMFCFFGEIHLPARSGVCMLPGQNPSLPPGYEMSDAHSRQLLMHLFLLALTIQEGSFRKIDPRNGPETPKFLQPVCRIEFEQWGNDEPDIETVRSCFRRKSGCFHQKLLYMPICSRDTFHAIHGYSDIISEHNLPGTDAERLARELFSFCEPSERVRCCAYCRQATSSIDLVPAGHQSNSFISIA